MKSKMSLILLLICCSNLLAQQFRIRLYLAPAIDTSNAAISQVVRLWGDYLNSNPDSLYDNPYWIASEKHRYERFDFLNSVYFAPSLYSLTVSYKPTVMSVSQIDSGFIIRTLFARQADSAFSRPFCITRVMAKWDGDAFRLCNILPFNTRSWQREKVGSITFVFPASHHFNRELGLRLNSFVDSLTTIWNIKPFPTEFYLTDDLSEIMPLRGLDFYVGESYNRGIGGLTDVANRIVFGGGQDEWYPHEFVHIYVNPLFPKAHRYFLEGYAALLGGSKGHELPWHMERMRQYLQEHPEIDLNNLLAFWRFDPYTDPQYVFGGLLCKLALEKGGLPTLKELFSFGVGDRDFYNAIESIFGVKQQRLNQFVRTKVAEYATR
jgi:hypothetical protein